MYKIITVSDFRDEFHRAGRGNQFSYNALGALYEFIEESSGTELGTELDVIALCCDFTENTLENIKKDYSNHFDDDDDNDDVLKELESLTLVIWHDGENVLYQNF